ncbi:tetratricopeptide repeat protein [Myroides injenensis]|uniref:tetratricopeptide repeat protein n=1 Tax=Myroides injenensis TaxID=1183151 RepID=UPI000287FA13|nr:tetratricopeptide repeat protein [Myroides injenensis]
MATYNKRGYKAPKPEESKDSEFDKFKDVSDSKTAEVFNSLDASANRMEGWVARNQKAIFGIVGAIALVTIGYVGYDKFVVEPKNEDAANQMFQAQSYYTEALTNTSDKDNLYNLALNGGEGKLGFLKVIEQYKGTDAANLGYYYAGMSYLNLGQFQEAIKYLEKYNGKGNILGVLAKGAIGDAFSELGQKEEALEYYKKAISEDRNDFTTPRFLNKAGIVALDLGKKEEALKMFNEIKNNYLGSPEYSSVDGFIGLAQ